MTLHRHSGKAGYFMDVRDWLCFRARDKEVVFKTFLKICVFFGVLS